MPYSRLACDVSATEDAELLRLEGGWARCHDPPTANARASPADAAANELPALEGARMGTPGLPPEPAVPERSAAPIRNSTVEAARARVRGPSLTEQRLRAAAEAEEAEAEKKRQAAKRKRACSTAGDGEVVPASTAALVEARACANAVVKRNTGKIQHVYTAGQL